MIITGKVRIGISSCLFGRTVRYDGENRQDLDLLNSFEKHVEWVPVCPEVEFGLPVPREPMHLVGNPDAPRLVTRNTGIDYTDDMLVWVSERLKKLGADDLCGFIFKSKSPSCSIYGVDIHPVSEKQVRKVPGIFSGLFMKQFPLIPVEDEAGLRSPEDIDRFIKCVSVYSLNKK